VATVVMVMDGTGKLASVLGASGLGTLLFKVAKRKSTLDILIALLKDATTPEERRKLLEAMRGRF
jgi:ABC-type proline/glycine betaine transport system permease subunit